MDPKVALRIQPFVPMADTVRPRNVLTVRIRTPTPHPTRPQSIFASFFSLFSCRCVWGGAIWVIALGSPQVQAIQLPPQEAPGAEFCAFPPVSSSTRKLGFLVHFSPCPDRPLGLTCTPRVIQAHSTGNSLTTEHLQLHR